MATNKLNYQKHAFTIKGEDSESDDDFNMNNENKLRRMNQTPQPNINMFNFLLNDRSYSYLWKQFNNYMLKYFSLTTNKLLCTDNYVMQSEITLQSIYYNMEILNTNSEIILNKLKLIGTENFIPLTK